MKYSSKCKPCGVFFYNYVFFILSCNTNVTLVNDIAKVQVSDDKCVNFYSFATKYCSRHKPTEYPIFDSFVEKLLKYFRDADKKIIFQNDDLKDYQKYKCILLDFQKKYGLEDFNLKQIDKYLW
jgi:hypothetical protein